MRTMFGEDSEFLDKSFEKCIKDDIDESDWRPFYEMYKCLTEEIMKFKDAYEPIEKIQNKCNSKYNIRGINIHDSKISKANRESYGCYVKCVHEHLGSLKDGSMNTSSFSKSFSSFPEIEKALVNTLESCFKEVNKKYEGKPKDTCDYFFDYNLCTDKNDFMKNL